MKRITTSLTLVVLSLYLLASGYMYSAQESMIFKPTDQVEPIAEVFPKASEYWIDTPDGESLQTWYKPAEPDKETLVYLHGNAGNLSTRGRLINVLAHDGQGALIFSWRGFGQSSGTPSERGFYTDADAIFNWLSERGLPPESVIVYAESLGTGVAVELAKTKEFKGVILAAPYLSVAQLAKDDYPWLPVDLLLKHRFDSIAKIEKVSEPLVVMHSSDDAVIPFVHGEALFANAGDPKRFMNFTDREHTGFKQIDIDSAIEWILANQP